MPKTKSWTRWWKNPSTFFEIEHSVNGHSGPFLVTAGSSFSSASSVTVGDNIPGWRERIKAGLGATTNLDGTISGGTRPTWNSITMNLSRFDASLGRVVYQSFELYGVFSHLSAPPQTQSTDLTKTDLAARQQFAQQIKRAQRHIQGLVTLGELGETVRMIKNRARSLSDGCYRYLSDVKKRSRRRGKKPVRKVIADTWLENAFGWQPLINDVVAGAESLAELQRRNPPNRRVTARAHRRTTETDPVQTKSLPGGTSPLWKVQYPTYKVYDTRVRYVGSVRLNLDHTTRINSVFGLQLSDLVPSLWELIPYSFLVDYFTNIGDLLDNWSIQRQDVAWAEYGHELSATRVHAPAVLIETIPPGGWTVTGKQFDGGTETFTTQRVVKRAPAGEVDFTAIPFQWEIPGIASKKWLNIAALALASKRTSSQMSAY